MKEHGMIILTDPQGEKQIPTQMCPHCGCHFKIIKGSGHKRGFCMNCMGPLCDKKECIENCVPIEKKLDLYEKGKLKSL